MILCFCFSKSYETSGNVEDEEQEEEEEEEEEGLLQLRHDLMNYDFQKCPRIKKEAFQDLVVDDIDLIRIAVIGPTGAGKTSLVGKRFVPFQISTAFISEITAKWLVDQQAI